MADKPVEANMMAEPAGTTGAGQNPAIVNSPTATTDDIHFPNNGKTWVRVVNKNAAAATLQFVTSKTVKGLAVADVLPGAANVPGSGTNDGVTEFGPFEVDLFGTEVHMTWSAGGGAGGLDFAAFTLP